ncbi:glycoside hydrolase family 43 protein [Nesterenkonia flava]|uniref:Glycoside hydrolase family 43 protein n=1 Tax=Nesterenkonia flava TaxID=469799 RepID=A0ABU1FQ50_9MICC|nr:glycoside hydrolase family 43 protein [Nesterenkonia flava]MDR5710753.1 glycoside hydrolase family 43 protein [Nesterenkonia flava]
MTVVENPLLRGCYPDPSLCRAEDGYYLVASTFEYFPALPIFRSRDLAHWEQIGHAVDRPGQMDFDGIPSSGGIYAPTIRFHEGTFYLVCTLVNPRQGAPGGNFLITATDPAGPWSDPVWLDVEGFDPSLFFDDDGRVWLHGNRLVADPEWEQQSEIWLRELDLVTGRVSDEETILWTGALIGGIWSEAPHLFRKDGRYYLLTAEGGTAQEHSVMIAAADAVQGPYRGNPANPVLTHRHLGKGADVIGVGHADLVEAPDGSWWAVALGMRPYGGYHYNLGRETFLVPVTWEDGWPVFAPGQGRLPAAVEVPTTATHVPGGAHTPAVSAPSAQESAGGVAGQEAGVVGPDDLRWTALRAPIESFAEPLPATGTGEVAGWRLRVQPADLTQPTTPSFLGIRQQHMSFDAVATLELSGLAAGERAGVVLRQSEDHHITLSVHRTPEGDVLRAVRRLDGDETVISEHRLPERIQEQQEQQGHLVRLGISAREQDYALSIDGEHIAAVDGRVLDTVSTGGFLGLWVGVFATSDGAPTNSTITLERFEYRPA